VNLLVDVQTISIVIAASGLFIVAVNQILSRRRTEAMAKLTLDTRQAQLFMQVYNRWSTPVLQKCYGSMRYLMGDIKDYDEWVQKYSIRSGESSNMETWLNTQVLATYFEGWGVLVKKGLIDVDMVDDLFAGRIKWYWEWGEPFFNAARKSLNDPKLYDGIEYLYNEIMKRDQQQSTTST